MLDKVLETIARRSLIESGDKIVAGVSGGPDSVCLLHVLHSLSAKINIKVFAIHINHGLRGDESDADEAFTQKMCDKMGIYLRSLAFDISEASRKEKVSLEEAGREIRYREFERYASEIGAAKIAVAHNKNDQAETVMMNILRGAGLKGMAGMDYQRGRIIRPLLDISRHDIEKYCEENNLSYRIDSSNLKAEFTRNRLRLETIPGINKSFGVDLTETLHRMASILKNDSSFLEEAALKAFNGCFSEYGNNYVALNIKGIRNLHPALFSRVVLIAVSRIKGDLKDIGSKHIEDIIELVNKGRTGSVIQLPENIRAGISYNLLKFYTEKIKLKNAFSYELKIPGLTYISETAAYIDASIGSRSSEVDKYMRISYNSLEQFFDYDRLKRGINIRNRQEGDIFAPFKSRGTKKIKEYFIDNKIPRDKRDEIPLITMGSEVVWIIGYKISDKFKVTENTKTILRLKYEIPLMQEDK